MIHIDIRPVWRFTVDGAERDLDLLLIALLEALLAEGKLTRAAAGAGISYRHAWNLIAQWQAFLGAPLVTRSRGKGTVLTPLGEKLLWAGRRARDSLAPQLANLAGECAGALNESLHARGPALAIHASHDFALAALAPFAADAGLVLDVQCRGSFAAIAALQRGECDLAGFHVPDGPMGFLLARGYAQCLSGGPFRLVALAARTQGFIVRRGNPKAIATVADLARPGVRMVNRQRGSGTRALLECLLSQARVDRARLEGYGLEEITHGAVAALVAGGQADAGFGVEAAAVQYGLDFVPHCRERYYLVARTASLRRTAPRRLLAILKSPAFRALVNALPGYEAQGSGASFDAQAVLPISPSTETTT